MKISRKSRLNRKKIKWNFKKYIKDKLHGF